MPSLVQAYIYIYIYIYIHIYIYIYRWLYAGASIPSKAMMHFPPVLDFPMFPKNCLTPWKISQILPFSRKIFRFSSVKISDHLFLIINHKFRISPYLLYFPLFSVNLRVLYIHCVFRFPLLNICVMHLCITQCTYWTPLGTAEDDAYSALPVVVSMHAL